MDAVAFNITHSGKSLKKPPQCFKAGLSENVLYNETACCIGFVYKITAKMINKAEEAHCLKNMPQQLQAAGRVTHDVKTVMMCEHLRSQFVGTHRITRL